MVNDPKCVPHTNCQSFINLTQLIDAFTCIFLSILLKLVQNILTAPSSHPKLINFKLLLNDISLI